MREGWLCPNCGKAHAPWMATCDQPSKQPKPISPNPWIPWNPPPIFPTTADPLPWKGNTWCSDTIEHDPNVQVTLT